MESKFKPGDKVRVINYGHPYWTSKKTYYEIQEHFHNSPSFIDILMGWESKPTPYIKSKPENIISETEDFMTLDMNPEIVGQEGVIEGSYKDLYPRMSNRDSDYHIYSLREIEGKSAWYNEDQLELV